MRLIAKKSRVGTGTVPLVLGSVDHVDLNSGKVFNEYIFIVEGDTF
jgi:hypothetical protein